jgi:hypothetical protein
LANELNVERERKNVPFRQALPKKKKKKKKKKEKKESSLNIESTPGTMDTSQSKNKKGTVKTKKAMNLVIADGNNCSTTDTEFHHYSRI